MGGPLLGPTRRLREKMPVAHRCQGLPTGSSFPMVGLVGDWSEVATRVPTMRETPDTPPANATAQAMPGEFPWDPVPGVPQSTWISLEAESVDWKGIQL